MRSTPLILVKQQLLTGHDSHYAGGMHLFSCLAAALAQHTGQPVHTVSLAPKPVILAHAVTHSLLHRLKTRHTSSRAEVVSWQHPSIPGLHHHCVVPSSSQQQQSDAPCSNQPGKGANSSRSAGGGRAQQACVDLLSAVAELCSSLAAEGQVGQLLLDIDTLQHATVPTASPLSALSAMVASADQGTGALPHTTQLRAHAQCVQEQSQQAAQQPAVPFMLALAQLCHCGCAQQQQLQAADPMQQPAACWQLLALVQNLHHLPFGPCGTGPRSPAVLQAWRSVAGVVCVSQFVRSYFLQHAQPLLPHLHPQHVHAVHPAAFQVWGTGPFEDLGITAATRLWGAQTAAATAAAAPAASDCTSSWFEHAAAATAGAAGAGAATAHRAMPAGTQPDRCSGRPARAVLGTVRNQELVAAASNSTTTLCEQLQQAGLEQAQQGQQWQQAPMVGMLKLTREKGSDLLLALAAHLPQLQFKAVCAEPQVVQQVAQAGCSNVQLVQPVADVSAALQGVALLLVPSILQEAFGMVVLDAMLHGVPVLVAAAGALPEAAAGTSAGLPVPLVQFPPARAPAQPAAAAAPADSSDHSSDRSRVLQGGASSAAECSAGSTAAESACLRCWLEGQRSWDSRVYPPVQHDHVRSWAAAIQQVLSSRDRYLQLSSHSRATAQRFVQQGPEQLAGLMQWLKGLRRVEH